jgi:hypothetical protein
MNGLRGEVVMEVVMEVELHWETSLICYIECVLKHTFGNQDDSQDDDHKNAPQSVCMALNLFGSIVQEKNFTISQKLNGGNARIMNIVRLLLIQYMKDASLAFNAVKVIGVLAGISHQHTVTSETEETT